MSKQRAVQLLTESSWTPDMSTFKVSPIEYSYDHPDEKGKHETNEPPVGRIPNRRFKHLLGMSQPFQFDVVHDDGSRKIHRGAVRISTLNPGGSTNVWELATQKKVGPLAQYTAQWNAVRFKGNEHVRAIEKLTHGLMNHFFDHNDLHKEGRGPAVISSTTYEPSDISTENIKAELNFRKMRRFHTANSHRVDIYRGSDIPKQYHTWVSNDHTAPNDRSTILVKKNETADS